VGGLIIGGHARGEPLDDVLRAFLLRDPKLEAWLIEQAEQFAELTAKERDSRLRKNTAETKAVTVEIRERKEALAIEEIERQYAPEAA
jgi:hypothetical protein